ncbi:MAG: hypothetical protein WKF75_00755 [Singulisphaera sp.]
MPAADPQPDAPPATDRAPGGLSQVLSKKETEAAKHDAAKPKPSAAPSDYALGQKRAGFANNVLKQADAKLRSGTGETMVTATAERQSTLEKWIDGTQDLKSGRFLKLLADALSVKPETLTRTLTNADRAAIKGLLPDVVAAQPEGTPAAAADAAILDTPAKVEEAYKVLVNADAFLRRLVPGGSAQAERFLSATERAERLNAWVKGEGGDKYFLDKFLAKQAGRPVTTVPEKDLSTLKDLIAKVVVADAPGASPGAGRPGAGDFLSSGGGQQILTIADDFTDTFGVPGFSEFGTLIGDVETLVGMPGFPNPFRNCRLFRGDRARFAGAYLIVD